MSFACRPIDPSQALDLRQRVLRPHLPLETSRYTGDELADALHMGAFQDERLVAIASFLPDPHPALSLPVRLRGMAVEPQRQGLGIGSVLLTEALARLALRGLPGIWCNARTPAVAFYRKLGFQTWGDEFEMPDIGPHFVAYIRF